MQRAAMALESHAKVAVLTKDSEQALAAVAAWLKSEPAIDQRPALLALMSELHPGCSVSIHSALDNYNGAVAEGNWAAFAHTRDGLKSDCGYHPAALRDLIVRGIKAKTSAPVLVDGIPVDQLSAVMSPTA